MKANILALYGIAFAPPLAHARELNGIAGATIVPPLAIENEAPLYFGRFSPAPGADGRLTLHETGIESDGVVTLFSNDQSAARFRVTGEAGAVYTIEVPNNVTLMSPQSSKLVAELVPLGPRHLGDGEDTFFVCAHLTVPAGQEVADYSGTFVVTVNYQ